MGSHCQAAGPNQTNRPCGSTSLMRHGRAGAFPLSRSAFQVQTWGDYVADQARRHIPSATKSIPSGTTRGMTRMSSPTSRLKSGTPSDPRVSPHYARSSAVKPGLKYRAPPTRHRVAGAPRDSWPCTRSPKPLLVVSRALATLNWGPGFPGARGERSVAGVPEVDLLPRTRSADFVAWPGIPGSRHRPAMTTRFERAVPSWVTTYTYVFLPVLRCQVNAPSSSTRINAEPCV